MCAVKIDELGRVLRARRTAAGRTIASVAVDAGLSVPYIANLENGRGNPTLAALASLVRALGATLRVDLVDPPVVPAEVLAFARGPRFAEVAARVAVATGQSDALVREKLAEAFVAVASVAGRFGEADGNRVLDAVLLSL